MLYAVQGSGIFIRDNINIDYINISDSSGFKSKHPNKNVEYIILDLNIINENFMKIYLKRWESII